MATPAPGAIRDELVRVDNSLEFALHEPDIDRFRQLAASGRRAVTLSETIGGNLDRRHLELPRPDGFGDELRGRRL